MTENEDNSHRIVNNKSVEEFKSNNKISIEDIDYFSKKVRITSPRSIKAMNNLGINNQDLEFLTFKEYLEKNPRLIAESKRIQKLEYNHIQAIRKDLINQVIEARKMIISEGNHNKKRSASSRYRKSIAIEICYSKSGGARYVQAEENCVQLVAYLLKKYGLDVDRVK